MKSYTLLKSLIDSHNNKTIDILVNNEKGIIEKIQENISVENSENFETITEYTGLMAFPGFIDPHVHFRVPGKPESENWKSGSLAALSAGVTTVFDMPNTVPPTINKESLELKLNQIKKDSRINYGIFGGLTHDNLDFLLENPSVNAIKVYLASTTGDMLIDNLENINLSKSQKVVCFHAEDESIIEENSSRCGILKNPFDHSRIRSEEAAIKSVLRVISLHEKTGGNFHIAHVSTPAEIDALLSSGLTFESAPHHIFCSTENYNIGGFLWKCNPPLRDKGTQEGLLKRLYEEKIPMIATDHAPHPLSSKSFEHNVPASGIPSIEVGTHFILNEMGEGRISPSYTTKILSSNSAERFSIKRRGFLKEGFFADIAIVDPDCTWSFEDENILSQCGWSPFTGTSFKAKVVATFVNGCFYKTSQLKENIENKKYKIYQV